MPGDVKFEWNGDAIKEQMIERANTAGRAWAELVLEQAQRFAPVDTGELVQSGFISSDNMDQMHVVGFKAPHSFYVEFGYRSVGGWVEGQYYLTRAVAMANEAFPEIVAQSFSHGYHSESPHTWQHGVIVGP